MIPITISERLFKDDEIKVGTKVRVKATTGKTFKTLLCERRLDRAAELLISSDLTADEIIRYVGYENSSYFYRAFFKRFEMTPKSYREKG